MPSISSPLIGQIQLGYSPGPGLDIPEFIMPVLSVPLPVLQLTNVAAASNRALEGSQVITAAINHGASTGPQSVQLAGFGRGVYRVSCKLHSTNFVGPAASSASPLCARIALYTPTSAIAYNLCTTFLEVSVPHEDNFQGTFNFVAGGWSIWLETFVTTGVGQSIGAYGSLYLEKLL